VVEERVDLIEINHFHDEQGKHRSCSTTGRRLSSDTTSGLGVSSIRPNGRNATGRPAATPRSGRMDWSCDKFVRPPCGNPGRSTTRNWSNEPICRRSSVAN
jgi:hypothetical protein